MLARLLKLLGHEVDVVHSGEAALTYLATALPDLVILDLMMPGIDCAEVLRRAREEPRTRRVPITIFSAVTDPAVRDHLLVKGAQDFWLKGSFEFSQLGKRVDSLFAAGAG